MQTLTFLQLARHRLTGRMGYHAAHYFCLWRHLQAGRFAIAVSEKPRDNALAMGQLQTSEEFWQFYLTEHSHAATRWLHFFGTSLVFASVIASLLTPMHWLCLFAPLLGYGPAWIGHFFIEHNKPASWKYPLRSFAADMRLWGCMATGRYWRDLPIANTALRTD